MMCVGPVLPQSDACSTALRGGGFFLALGVYRPGTLVVPVDGFQPFYVDDN